MRPKLYNICKTTGKITYSEPAAIRAVEAVDGARRHYRCEACNGFHITKVGRSLAIKSGLLGQIAINKGTIELSAVEQRIKELKKKKEIRISNLN